MPDGELLFRCTHGSHLYGLARPTSDKDVYEVWTKPAGRNPWVERRGVSRQRIEGETDVTSKDLGTFLREASFGVPQALEAMFAPASLVEVDRISHLRAGFRATGPGVTGTYLRTIKSFAYGGGGGGGAWKKRRHAIKLAVNGRELTMTGRMSPQLSDRDRLDVMELSSLFEHHGVSPETVFDVATAIFWGAPLVLWANALHESR